MFETDNGFILYDHELAFTFADKHLLGSDPIIPGQISRNDKFVTDHILYKLLKGKPVEFDPFIDNLKELSNSVLDVIIDRMPEEWRTEEVAHIRDFLTEVSHRADDFQRSLQEVLAK